MVTTDFFERLLPQSHQQISALKLARVLTLIVGFGVTLLSYLVDRIARLTEVNIMELMPKGFNMFLGPLAGLFFIGMFLPRCRSRSAIGAVIGWSIGLTVGGTTLLAVLAGSASYIAAPAAIRIAVPQANPSLSLTASLGVTFPFNIFVGIPVYFAIAGLLHSNGG